MRISKGKKQKAQRVVIYGPEGIGKSTFASCFPDPVFIDTEGSTFQLDVARFEETNSKARVMEAISAVKSGEVECQTLVIDTWDWLEKMCIKDLLDKHGCASIEDFGYGKGYVRLQENERDIYAELDKVIDRGVNVVITAHAQMRKFEQPDEMGAYDRWELKLEKKTAPMLKEWADMVLFANYKTIVVEDAKTKTKKAQGGKRVMYTSHHACWDAKNRHGLKECLPFEYKSIENCIPGSTSAEKPKPEPEPKPKQKTGKKEEKAPETPPAVEADVPDVKKGGPIHQKMYELMDRDGIAYCEVQIFLEAKGILTADKLLADIPEKFVQGQIIDKWAGFSKAVKKMSAAQEIPFLTK